MANETMIERVARALFDRADSRAGQPSYERDLRWEVGKPLYIDDARSVLTAMRNIDLDTQNNSEIEMLIRGRAVLPEHDEPMQEDALNCWKAMIDAALTEPPCPPQ